MNQSFGTWVKRRRKSLDLTQQELAKEIGCSPSLIFKIESDERRPSRQMAELLAEKLDVPTDQRPLFLKTARQEKNTDSLDAIPPLSPLAPVSAPEPRHSHLPVSPTPLVGREQEIHTLTKQLLDPACRLLTLTGPGGIGKTRLAIEAGRALEPHFADGVYFISLAGVGMPEAIIPAIADKLHFGFSGPADPIVQLANHLHDKQTLLIIDNMEHLLEGRDQLGQILQNTHHIKIIVTSREQLRLQWEWLFEVQGLPLPEEQASLDDKTNSAIQLFIQRAKQASQSFSIETEDVAAIVRICRMVGGLPLAIELAASWVRMLSAREIVHELEKSLDFLETQKTDIPPRHRSIKTVFDHSWELLTENEHDLLMKLSVFQGGFTREAAITATGASLFLLSSLVDKSLLRYNKHPERYELHELVRTYALEKLQSNPSTELTASTKYAEHYAGWIASLEWELKSERQNQISHLIRSETCNWHCTWHWAIEKQRFDLLRKMIFPLSWYFEVNGNYDEAISSAKTAVDHFYHHGAPDNLKTTEEQATFAALVDTWGWFEFRKGNVELGVKLLSQGLEIAKKSADPEVLYFIYGNWGYLSLLLGNAADASRFTTESLHYGKMLKPWHQAIAISVLGIVAYQQGNLHEAKNQLTESLNLWRPVGDPRGLVFSMLYLGMTAIALKEYASARSILQESNQIAEAKMDRWAYAFSLDLLGMTAMAQGQYKEALDYFKQSVSLSQEIGDQLNEAQTTIHLGQAYTATESLDEAKHIFLEVYVNAKAANWIPILLNCLLSFVEMPGELAPETRLMAALAIRNHAILTPNLRERSDTLINTLKANLDSEKIHTAELGAKEKSAEAWVSEILEERSSQR